MKKFNIFSKNSLIKFEDLYNHQGLIKLDNLFLGFFELGRKAKKLMDMGHGDEYQGQLSMASLYSEKLRLSSNDLLEFLKINDEIELINKLYKSKNLKNIKKFEELFYCENSN